MTRTAARQRVVVYGAGGHGKVVADVLLAAGDHDLVGFVDDDCHNVGATVMGLRVVGDGCWLERESAHGAIAVALGVGDNEARSRVAERCVGKGLSLTVAIHPQAVVAPSARISEGAVVMAGAVINPDAKIGRGAIINTGVVVEHDVVVGEWAHLSPNATTGGAVQIGAYAHVGLGAAVLPGLCVGNRAVVGAGAVVVRDVPEGLTVVGVPARPLASRAAKRNP